VIRDAHEQARLAALRSYEILDTKSEQAFDDLVGLAAEICEVPIALVSLLDTDRQWFKSRVGIDASETPREVAFCDHTIRQHGVMTVRDAREDARFRDNPLVTGAPNIRFYAGAPLVDDNRHALGTLCVIDREPRQLSISQAQALERLSRQVIYLLQLRRNSRQMASVLQRVHNIAELVPMCGHCHAVRNEADEWQRIEQYFHDLNGTKFTHGVCPACMVQHYHQDLATIGS